MKKVQYSKRRRVLSTERDSTVVPEIEWEHCRALYQKRSRQRSVGISSQRSRPLPKTLTR